MRRSREDAGYVMVVVLLIIAVLLSAGLYGIKAMESDLRATTSTRKAEFLARAAEAGAAQRLAQIATSRNDAVAALESNVAVSFWPPSGSDANPITWSTPNAAANTDLGEITQLRVTSQPTVTIDTRPPPGVQIGSGGQTTVWDIKSYAVFNGLGSGGTSAGDTSAGEHAVEVGVKVYSRGGRGYNDY